MSNNGYLTMREIEQKTTARYFYNTEDNKPNYMKCRYIDRETGEEIKGTYYSCIDSVKNLWKMGLNGHSHTLYRLPELLQAIKDGVKRIFIVEGEKDTDTLISQGETATTSGAWNSWKDEFAEYFRGYTGEVIILPDQDLPDPKRPGEAPNGQKYGEAVFNSLTGIVPLVYIVNVIQGKDISDFLQAKTMIDLETLIIPARASRLNQMEIEQLSDEFCMLPAAEGKPLPPRNTDNKPIENRKQKTLLDYDLKEEDLNLPSEWLVPEILSPYTITMLFSRSGGGKSFFTLLLSLSLLERGKIDTLIYLDNDNSKQALIGRKIGDIKRQFKERFIYVPSFKTDKELMKVLLNDLKDKKYGHCLIIVDSIRNFMAGKNPNDDKDAIAFMDNMKEIRGYDNTVIMLHHLNKSGQVKNNTSFGDYSDLSYFMETNNDKKQKRIFAEFSCNPDMGCKDRIGARENFIATIDYDIMQLIIGESGVNPEDFEFTCYVKDLLKEHGQLKQKEIAEYVKKELDIKYMGDIHYLLKKYTGIIWKFEKGNKNSTIYSLMENPQQKENILYYKYNNKNNILQKTENTGDIRERLTIDKTKTENTVITTERPSEEVRKLENRILDTKEADFLFSEKGEETEVKNGINTVFSVFCTGENKETGINTVFSSFLEKSGQVENRILENRTLESENSSPVEQVNNNCIKNNQEYIICENGELLKKFTQEDVIRECKARYNACLAGLKIIVQNETQYKEKKKYSEEIERCKDNMKYEITALESAGIEVTVKDLKEGFTI